MAAADQLVTLAVNQQDGALDFTDLVDVLEPVSDQIPEDRCQANCNTLDIRVG